MLLHGVQVAFMTRRVDVRPGAAGRRGLRPVCSALTQVGEGKTSLNFESTHSWHGWSLARGFTPGSGGGRESA